MLNECIILFHFSVIQGSENESKVFVCTSRSQLIDKSDLCGSLKVTDAEVRFWSLCVMSLH